MRCVQYYMYLLSAASLLGLDWINHNHRVKIIRSVHWPSHDLGSSDSGYTVRYLEVL